MSHTFMSHMHVNEHFGQHFKDHTCLKDDLRLHRYNLVGIVDIPRPP